MDIQLVLHEGDGPSLFCVHGLTANCRCWDRVAAALVPDFHITAMDLRGRGGSHKPRSGYSVDQHTRDILAVMDNLGIRRTVIMGHSLGAYISLAFGARYPDRVNGVVLVDGAGKLNDEQMAKVLAGIKPSLDRLGKTFPSVDAYLDEMKKSPVNQPWSEALEAYYRYELEECEGGVRSNVPQEAIWEEVANLSKLDADTLYGAQRNPVLILRAPEGMLAEDDILLPEDVLERMLRKIPNAKYENVAGTNHTSILFNDDPGRNQAIRNFTAQEALM